MDIRNLGNFASIEAVWEAYPNGGIEGDYLFIPNQQGTKYRWNKYIQQWENAAVVTETTSRQDLTVSDLNIQNELHVGSHTDVQGDLRVRGVLRAKHVKQPNVGLFATLEALQAAYPNPEVGMWATIGDSVPGYVYRCNTAGTWTATGETGGVDELENVLLYSDQKLTAAEQKQARANLGMSNGDFATGSDFDAPDSTNRAKVVTVGAVLDGADAVPTAGSKNLVRSGGVFDAVNSERERAELAEQNLQDNIDNIKDETLQENRQMVNSIMENYAPVEITGDVNNAADEEDLTSVNVEGTDVLKFKDKVYNPLVYSGLGRKILRKNMVNGVNVLTQDMFYKGEIGSMAPNTNNIFVIQYDYDLNNSTIEIPENCVLQFDGGSLRNGTINLNDCYINAGLNQIFNNIKLNNINTYNGDLEVIDNIYVKTLTANVFVNKKTNKLVPANTIINRRYIYRVTGSSNSTTIDGSNVKVSINGTTYTVASIKDGNYTFNYNYSSIIGIVTETGNMAVGTVESLEGISFYTITPISYSNISKIKNTKIHPEWFGAKGDNNNDDSIALNSALDLAHNSVKKVILNDGLYKINDTIVVNSQVNFSGIVPIIEDPASVCLSANVDIAVLIFDVKNHIGSFQIKNIGFIPFSDEYKHNFIAIKIYHFQNHALISKIGIRNASIGIDIDALYGVQMLRCEDISMLSVANQHAIAININAKLQGWVNANYFRFACTEHCATIKATCGGDNTLDGGSGYTESTTDYLINLDNAQFIIRGGLYKETGNIAKLRNNSMLLIEGNSLLIGEIDCDETSYIKNIGYQISKTNVLNNRVIENNVILKHYKKFSKNPYYWHETIENKILPPKEIGSTYTSLKYNGRIYTKGYCKVNTQNIDIHNKTIIVRGINTAPFTSDSRSWILTLNYQETSPAPTNYSLSKRAGAPNVCILYGPSHTSGDDILSTIERGEFLAKLPSKETEYVLKNMYVPGNTSFLISDIYIIDKPDTEIKGNEYIRIRDIIESLDAYTEEDGLIEGYTKGTTKPTKLTESEEGLLFYDTANDEYSVWLGTSVLGWAKIATNIPAFYKDYANIGALATGLTTGTPKTTFETALKIRHYVLNAGDNSLTLYGGGLVYVDYDLGGSSILFYMLYGRVTVVGGSSTPDWIHSNSLSVTIDAPASSKRTIIHLPL